MIGLIAALEAAGINIGALMASAGLIGFAVGFALKDLLSNVIAGLLLLFNKAIKKTIILLLVVAREQLSCAILP